MDYYEELGVARSASQEEIRRAWKRLARLFHPDLQTDPEIRETAEIQMRRLNHILSVLTEPWERAQYDLIIGNEQPGPARWDGPAARKRVLYDLFRFDRKAAVWLSCGAVASGLLAAVVLSSLRNVPTADRSATASAATASASSMPDATASLEARIDQLRKKYPPPPEHSRSTRDSEPSRTSDESLVADTAPTTPAKPFVPPPSRIGSEARPENRVSAQRPPPPPSPVIRPAGQPIDTVRAISPASPSLAPPPPETMRPVQPAGLAGLWRYTPPPHLSQRPGLYAAEHVEVGVSEESGVLYGYYTARYAVPDGGVSPDVNFKFSGVLGPNASTGTWAGTNGNRGEIRLRALSNDALEVVWVTTHVEHANSLASGKVTLSRAN